MSKYIPVEPEKWAEMVKALALVAEMDKTINASQAECRRLKAEVERLREAGDDLVRHIDWRNVVFVDPTLSFFKVHPQCLCNCHNFDEVIKAWNAAKEVQP